ncbi:SRPBCC family protein [Halopolyspora algeriensis]|nr:SRPBCC family protein [Halopolyspora algeriensis]
MGDYEHSATVRTSPSALFDYLSEVRNLPEYFEGMVSAESVGAGAVHVVAEVEGERREGEAWMETDEGARTMRWGSEGPNRYRGELRVTGEGDDSATVTVTLHTERADGPGIRSGLEATLANIKRHVEGRSTARS